MTDDDQVDQRVLMYVTNHPGASTYQIAVALGYGYRGLHRANTVPVRKALSRLARAGRARFTLVAWSGPGGQKSVWHAIPVPVPVEEARDGA